jgi:diguanylate cyclase (GGDEF)-like protein
MARKPLIRPRVKGCGRPEDLSAIDKSVRRLFYGVCGLGGVLAIMWMLAIPAWKPLARPLMFAVPALMIWSLAAAAYAFHTQAASARKIRDELVRVSLMDDVTQVFNFRYLDQRLAEEYERTRRYGGSTAIIFIDLDSFKQVNDSFGHQVGNAILKGLAGTMRDQARTCDVVGRVGGDEFLALLPQTDQDQAEVLADRLRATVAEYSADVGGGKTVDFVRASFGVAVYPTNGDSVESVISAADAAAYEAKRLGGDRVCVAKGFVTTEEMGEYVVRTVQGDEAGAEDREQVRRD